MFGSKKTPDPKLHAANYGYDGGASLLAEVAEAAQNSMPPFDYNEPGHYGFRIVPTAQGYELQRDQPGACAMPTGWFVPHIVMYWEWKTIAVFPTWEAAEDGISRVLHGKTQFYAADGTRLPDA